MARSMVHIGMWKRLQNNDFLNNFQVNDPIATNFSEIIWM